jgi:hypothetical protein
MAATDKYFLIAIGGTGMRCLESFTHLCAMGMFDSKEIDILTLDTDQTNGNKARAENLVRQYNKIKFSPGNEGGNVNSNTFFSAKLNLHEFWTNYDGAGRENFNNISHIHKGDGEVKENNKLLSDLFLDENVKQFNLAHGYRAQTHLGSYLMYHGLIESARRLHKGADVKTEDKAFEKFIEKIEKAGEHARIFVLGSIFGGTGASSIPIIPKAIDNAIKIRSGNKSRLDPGAKFGATLLTEYFSFKKPDASQMASKENSVIADSSFFSLNSQAALQFYQSDPTVKSTYKKMYHVGWPSNTKNYSEEGKDTKTITGGESQKNSCHVAELICASAAYDFFSSDKGLDVEAAEYIFKSVGFENNTLQFNFNDFIGDKEAGKLFANRLGAFFAFAHVVLSENMGAFGDKGVKALLNRLQKEVDLYTSITDEYADGLEAFIKMFGYDYQGENFKAGWIYQVRSTAPGSFVFRDEAFSRDSKELQKLDVGKLFEDEKYHWDKGGVFGDRYSTFISTLKNDKSQPTEDQNCKTTNEKFLAHIFNALSESQKII